MDEVRDSRTAFWIGRLPSAKRLPFVLRFPCHEKGRSSSRLPTAGRAARTCSAVSWRHGRTSLRRWKRSRSSPAGGSARRCI